MNAQNALSDRLARLVVAPLLPGRDVPDALPAQPPSGAGPRGAALWRAGLAIAGAEPELPPGTPPAQARLLRNREARRAAEEVDRVLVEEREALSATDRERLRVVANALSLGWEEVDAFLRRDPA